MTVSPFRDTTAWARNLAAPLRDFLHTESGGALVLLGATVAALLWANSPWPDSYESVWTTELSIRLGDHGISLELREWVNQGLMTFFFLVVGLEAKRELDVGQLRDRRRVATPLGAALGGMGLAVLVYLAFNAGGEGAGGWGAAMSTDTAFALGLLALVAPGGTRLRITLLTVAVFDDLVALLVIATVYTESVELAPLIVAAVLFLALLPLRYAPAAWRGPLAAVLGVAVWAALLDAGIDPVITGLAVGMITAAYPPVRADLEQVTELTRLFREQPSPQLARSAQLGVAAAISPNERLQYRLHPWTSFVIVPLFALANIGIHIDGDLVRDAVGSPDHARHLLRLRRRQAARHPARQPPRGAAVAGPDPDGAHLAGARWAERSSAASASRSRCWSPTSRSRASSSSRRRSACWRPPSSPRWARGWSST